VIELYLELVIKYLIFVSQMLTHFILFYSFVRKKRIKVAYATVLVRLVIVVGVVVVPTFRNAVLGLTPVSGREFLVLYFLLHSER
jgi:hypothetical protein